MPVRFDRWHCHGGGRSSSWGGECCTRTSDARIRHVDHARGAHHGAPAGRPVQRAAQTQAWIITHRAVGEGRRARAVCPCPRGAPSQFHHPQSAAQAANGPQRQGATPATHRTYTASGSYCRTPPPRRASGALSRTLPRSRSRAPARARTSPRSKRGARSTALQPRLARLALRQALRLPQASRVALAQLAHLFLGLRSPARSLP